MNIRSNLIIVLGLMIILLEGCHRTNLPLDPLSNQEQSIEVTVKKDKKRLEEIHECIERLVLSIEYETDMAERYYLLGDFSRAKCSLNNLQNDQDEISTLKKERSQIYKKALLLSKPAS